MNKLMILGLITFAAALLAPQILRAQKTMTYLSNLDQASAGSLAVGSDSWLAVQFRTGTNTSGYSLDSIQLAMADASGNPTNFTAMLYGNPNLGFGDSVGSSLGSLDGSLNPVSGGIYTYTPDSSLTLSPSTWYVIVLTAGTPTADGTYEWEYANPHSYNPSGGWSSDNVMWTSGDGLGWQIVYGEFPQYAIDATAIPEPGVLGLLSLGGLAFLWHRLKAKV